MLTIPTDPAKSSVPVLTISSPSSQTNTHTTTKKLRHVTTVSASLSASPQTHEDGCNFTMDTGITSADGTQRTRTSTHGIFTDRGSAQNMERYLQRRRRFRKPFSSMGGDWLFVACTPLSAEVLLRAGGWRGLLPLFLSFFLTQTLRNKRGRPPKKSGHFPVWRGCTGTKS